MSDTETERTPGIDVEAGTDANDEQDPTDTPCLHDPFVQMELYLRAMCEGYVDGHTSEEYACTHSTSTIFDFSFESLCLQAFGNRWFTLLPTSVRPDDAQGYGPLPNTEIMADTFNQFASAINLLTRVRVMLPMRLEVLAAAGSAVQYITPNNADGSLNTECTTGVCKLYYDGVPPDATVNWGLASWTELAGPIQAYVQSLIDANCSESGGWGLTTIRGSSQIRWQVSDPDSIYAIPEAWRDMLGTNATMLARVTSDHVTLGRVLTEFALSAHCCLAADEPCPGWWFFSGDEYWAFPENPGSTHTVTCQMMPGLLEMPALGASTHARGKTGSMGEDACTPGPLNSAVISPIIDNSGLIEVPLV